MICSAKPRTSSSGPGPVGVAAGVAEVDEVLGREEVDERPGDGEAPKPLSNIPIGRSSTPRRLRRRRRAASRSRRPGRRSHTCVGRPAHGPAVGHRHAVEAVAELLRHPGAADVGVLALDPHPLDAVDAEGGVGEGAGWRAVARPCPMWSTCTQ